MVINIADDQSGFKAERCKFHIFLILFMLNMMIMIQAIEDINSWQWIQRATKILAKWRRLGFTEGLFTNSASNILAIYYTIYTDINPLGSPCIPGFFGC